MDFRMIENCWMGTEDPHPTPAYLDLPIHTPYVPCIKQVPPVAIKDIPIKPSFKEPKKTLEAIPGPSSELTLLERLMTLQAPIQTLDTLFLDPPSSHSQPSPSLYQKYKNVRTGRKKQAWWRRRIQKRVKVHSIQKSPFKVPRSPWTMPSDETFVKNFELTNSFRGLLTAALENPECSQSVHDLLTLMQNHLPSQPSEGGPPEAAVPPEDRPASDPPFEKNRLPLPTGTRRTQPAFQTHTPKNRHENGGMKTWVAQDSFPRA